MNRFSKNSLTENEMQSELFRCSGVCGFCVHCNYCDTYQMASRPIEWCEALEMKEVPLRIRQTAAATSAGAAMAVRG